MAPRQGGRFCESCQKTVTDLSRMTEREADAWLVTVGDEACIRMRVDDDGLPLFARQRRSPLASQLAGVVTAASLAACADPATSDPAASAPSASSSAAPQASYSPLTLPVHAKAVRPAQKQVFQLEDLPRDTDAAPCDPDIHASAPSRPNRSHVMGGLIARPIPVTGTAALTFKVKKAQWVRVDDVVLSRAQLRKGAKIRVNAGFHTISYGLDGSNIVILTSLDQDEHKTLTLP